MHYKCSDVFKDFSRQSIIITWIIEKLNKSCKKLKTYIGYLATSQNYT